MIWIAKFSLYECIAWSSLMFSQQRVSRDQQHTNLYRYLVEKRRLMSEKRGKRHYFDIDVGAVYGKDGAKGGYVFVVYENSHEVLIGSIWFECADLSKVHVLEEFEEKIDRLMNVFNKKGLLMDEMKRVIAAKAQ